VIAEKSKEAAGIIAPESWRNPRTHGAAALTSPWYRSLVKLQAVIVSATFEFYAGRKMDAAMMPVTVGAVSSPMGLGSDSLPVEVDLFGERAFLADSMQFQLEYLLRYGASGVYYIMPTFRGEDADRTHLNQFFHSEAEIVGGLEDVIATVEGYIAALSKGLLEGAGQTIASIAGETNHLEVLARGGEFPRVEYQHAIEALDGSCFSTSPLGDKLITRKGEQELIRRHNGPVWLIHPPQMVVPFYQAVDETGRARSADLLMGVGEVVGCGERCVTAQETRESMARHQVDPTPYGWYLEMKETAPLRTAGFGLGVERFLMAALKHDDIRDLCVFPRIRGSETWI
jgi:asparaginyl-tRNA synthetase